MEIAIAERLENRLGVSGAEVEKVCGCLSCLPKATASLRFGLSESSVAKCEWRFSSVREYFVRIQFTTFIKYLNTTKQNLLQLVSTFPVVNSES